MVKKEQKLQQFAVKYQDGFYIMPYLVNSPLAMIESFKKIPFIKHNPVDQSLSSKTQFFNNTTYYRDIEEGLYLIHSEMTFKSNISFRKVSEKSTPSVWYCLSLRIDHYAKNINSIAKDVSYSDNSWLIFKPGAYVDHYHFKGTRGKYFSLYFTQAWLKKYLNQLSPKKSKQFKLFLKSANDYLICPNLPEDVVYDAEHLTEEIVKGRINIKKLKKDIFGFVDFFISKMESEQINENHFTISNQERIKILKAEKFLQKYLYRKFPGIEYIAQEVGLSETKLKQCFKKMYDCTLLQYFHIIQMKEAKELIASGKYKIMEVSSKMGYENASKFAAAFKLTMGVLPSEINPST